MTESWLIAGDASGKADQIEVRIHDAEEPYVKPFLRLSRTRDGGLLTSFGARVRDTKAGAPWRTYACSLGQPALIWPSEPREADSVRTPLRCAYEGDRPASSGALLVEWLRSERMVHGGRAVETFVVRRTRLNNHDTPQDVRIIEWIDLEHRIPLRVRREPVGGPGVGLTTDLRIERR